MTRNLNYAQSVRSSVHPPVRLLSDRKTLHNYNDEDLQICSKPFTAMILRLVYRLPFCYLYCCKSDEIGRTEIVSENDQDIPQSQTTHNPMAKVCFCVFAIT